MSNHLQPFFYEHIKEYTSRSLTYDSDALNAFKGIIASWKEYTYWGVPFTAAYPRMEVSAADSECAFAYGLAWVGKRLPPGGGPICRRGDFPTWSWTSMVDQIETKDKDYAVYFRTYKCSAFYVEDENHKRLRIVEVFKSAQERRACIIPEYGKTLLIEAYVAKVWLRLTEKEGIYSIHIPNNTIQDQTSPTPSLLTISGQALIDGGDTDILSKIESQPWDAVKLF
jgi:hypothetical protein